jgi:hypothetical protein
MSGIDSVIQILKLNVTSNDILWSLSNGVAQKDSLIPVDSGRVSFEISALDTSTINLLIEQLQFLADIIRDFQIQEETRTDASTILSELVVVLGENLYKTLFRSKIHDVLTKALQKKGLSLLRIELEFENKTLASWPWEYLYGSREEYFMRGFLAERTELVLNRRLYPGVLTVKLNNPPPKVLLIVSRPLGPNKVKCDTVIKAVERLRDDGVIHLTELIEKEEKLAIGQQIVTRENVRKTIGDFQPHIIHFIGHGQCTDKGGQIAFVKEGWEEHWISEEDFATLAGGSKDLKLVFLQACESALPNPYDNVLGMARQLAAKNIPAVVAMQYKVENEIANTFACNFYEALVDGQSVDLAVKAGRDAIKDDPEYQNHAFGLPVLYLSSYENMIQKRAAQKPKRTIPTRVSGSVVPGGNALPATEYISCPACKASNSPISKYCNKCGERLMRFVLVCQFCKAKQENPVEGIFCDKCGKRLRCKSCGEPVEDMDSSLCRNCSSGINELVGVNV